MGAVKELLRAPVVAKLYNEYFCELEASFTSYDSYIKDYEESHPASLAIEDEGKTAIFNYDYVSSNHDLSTMEGSYVIFTSDEAGLDCNAEALICNTFKENKNISVIYGDEDYFAFIYHDAKHHGDRPAVASENAGGISSLLRETDEPKAGIVPFDACRCLRFFKPEFSPDTLCEFNYINSFAVKGECLKEIMKEVSEKEATKRSFVISHPDGDFYYRNGSFYRYKNDKYVTHRPFVGFRVPEIPHFHHVFTKEGVTYHYFNRVFYTYNESFDYYEVVAPPKDMLVAFIPSYSKCLKIGNSNFYIADGMKFLAIFDDVMPLFKIIEVDEKEYSKNNKVTYYSCY